MRTNINMVFSCLSASFWPTHRGGFTERNSDVSLPVVTLELVNGLHVFVEKTNAVIGSLGSRCYFLFCPWRITLPPSFLVHQTRDSHPTMLPVIRIIAEQNYLNPILVDKKLSKDPGLGRGNGHASRNTSTSPTRKEWLRNVLHASVSTLTSSEQCHSSTRLLPKNTCPVASYQHINSLLPEKLSLSSP